MPHSPAKKTESGVKTNKESRNEKKDETPRKEQWALELAREWNSPPDGFQQHLYVE
jgi:hypothetical protein